MMVNNTSNNNMEMSDNFKAYEEKLKTVLSHKSDLVRLVDGLNSLCPPNNEVLFANCSPQPIIKHLNLHQFINFAQKNAYSKSAPYKIVKQQRDDVLNLVNKYHIYDVIVAKRKVTFKLLNILDSRKDQIMISSNNYTVNLEGDEYSLLLSDNQIIK